jgi:hypothetical protein
MILRAGEEDALSPTPISLCLEYEELLLPGWRYTLASVCKSLPADQEPLTELAFRTEPRSSMTRPGCGSGGTPPTNPLPAGL